MGTNSPLRTPSVAGRTPGDFGHLGVSRVLGGDELVMSQVGDHVHECVHDDLLGKVNNKAEREEEVDLGSWLILDLGHF